MTSEGERDETLTEPIPVLLRRPGFRDVFTPLRIRNYRYYAIIQLLANTANWAMRIAVDWLVFELTSSVALVGVTTFLFFGPMLALGPIGGLIADRYPRRRLLSFTQGTNAVACAALAVLVMTGVIHLFEVFAAALLMGLTAVVDSPARSVFVQEMVGQSKVGNAIAINGSTFHLGGLVGPALSGVLIAAFGAGWAIASSAIAAVFFVAALWLMRESELLRTVVVPPRRGQIAEAVHYSRRKPTIFWPTVMLGFVAAFGMNLPVMLVAFADHEFKSGAAGYGLYSSIAALGALFGSLASTRRLTYRLRSLMLAAGCFGLTIVVTGIAPVVSIFLVCLFAIGFVRLLFTVAAEAIVQMSCNRVIRGRVMAIFAMTSLGAQAIGGPFMGWVIEYLGVRPTTMIFGAVPVIAAAVISIHLARSGKLTLKFKLRRHIFPLTVEVQGRVS
ncbi:MAG: MFS transporter [Cryobacterium sp.]|nr:MFS transporter [Cryobacterium sp.]MBX3090231.1 MFS transporter [Cryobacterium sp.]MBX3116521.1 MFS transporter [Cryobacterium sp.]